MANATTEAAIGRVSLAERELVSDDVDIAIGLDKANQSMIDLHHRAFTDVTMNTTAIESASQIRCTEVQVNNRSE